MESALEELELARHHLTAVEEKASHLNTTHATLLTLQSAHLAQHMLSRCLGQCSLALELDAAPPYAG